MTVELELALSVVDNTGVTGLVAEERVTGLWTGF